VLSERWDVILVPFPFSERPGQMRRPALVLSDRSFNRCGHSILTMVTTSGHAPWPGDTPLQDHHSAGVPLPCMVRLKLFTLDNRLTLRKLGRLSERDIGRVAGALKKYVC
jgi:mRNA interferase MazF